MNTDDNNQQKVLITIREIHRETGRPVSPEDIAMRSDQRDWHYLRKILEKLNRMNCIKHDPNSINGWLPTDEFAQFRSSDVSEIKVKQAIISFFKMHTIYPKPTEVEDEYTRLHGNPKMKDFQRYLRLLAEKGILSRTKTYRYYTDEIKSLKVPEETGLNNFLKKS